MAPIFLHINCPSRTAPAEKQAIKEIAKKDERFVTAVEFGGKSRKRSKISPINSYLTRESEVLQRFLTHYERPGLRETRTPNSLGDALGGKKSVYLDISGATLPENKSKHYDLLCSVCCDGHGTDLHSHILRSVIARDSVVSFELRLLKPSLAKPKVIKMGSHVRALYMITFYSVYSSLFSAICADFETR